MHFYQKYLASIETYIRRYTMRAILVIPVHCTDPIQLLYAQHLFNSTVENNMSES